MNAYLIETGQEWAAVVLAPTPGRAKTLLLREDPLYDLEFTDIKHLKAALDEHDPSQLSKKQGIGETQTLKTNWFRKIKRQ